MKTTLSAICSFLASFKELRFSHMYVSLPRSRFLDVTQRSPKTAAGETTCTFEHIFLSPMIGFLYEPEKG